MKQFDTPAQLARRVPARFVRYLVAGGLCAALEWGGFLLLFYVWSWSIIWANTISFFIVLIVNFTLTKVLEVFAVVIVTEHRCRRQCTSVWRSSNVAVSNVIVAGLSQVVAPGFAKLMTMAAVVSWNFVLMRLGNIGTAAKPVKEEE